MEYHGTLLSFDEYMNFQLNDCSEWINDENRGHLGEILIRNNNVLYIRQDDSPAQEVSPVDG
jgi:small nuclear ribonucleoprotein F